MTDGVMEDKLKSELLDFGPGKSSELKTAKTEDEKIKAAILLIYNSSQERILKVADNVARGIIQEDEVITLEDNPKPLLLPESEDWDFLLGDTVQIKLSRDDFKFMQKRTLGWRSDLNELIGQTGVVTEMSCKFENAIGVYFPDVFTRAWLYAGVLKTVPGRKDPNLLRRWEVGDSVKTISSSKVLALLQKGLSKIPEKYIGKKGRVVAVTHPCIVVTFDNSSTLDFKSRSLVPCNSQEEIVGDKCDQIDEEVKIISNLKKLIGQQKYYGQWNPDMTNICGKNARVIRIQEDGSMNVQIKHFRAWRLNPSSILHSSHDDETREEDLEFLPGDVVKVTVPQNIRSILYMAGVPSVFLEYLRAPAVLTLVDADLDYLIRFNAEQNVQTHEKVIRKATVLERQAYEKVRNLTENLKVGDQVHLDIGPPNFVRSVIAELEMGPAVTMALTKPAILEGYTNAYTAVIKYKDGTRIKLKKKYLTVPQKFHYDECNFTRCLPAQTIARIEETISRGVRDIHRREGARIEEMSVQLTHLRQGNPPCLEFRIKSSVASFSSISSWLENNSDWTTKCLGDGLVVIGAEEHNKQLEVKTGLIFNDEPSFNSVSSWIENDSDWTTECLGDGQLVVIGAEERNKQLEVKTGLIVNDEQSGHGEAEVKRESPTSANKAQPINADNNGEDPEIASLSQFSYLRLCHPAFAQTVYFPYFISLGRHSLIQHGESTRSNSQCNDYDRSSNKTTCPVSDL